MISSWPRPLKVATAFLRTEIRQRRKSEEFWILKVIYEENRENLVTMEMEVEMEKIERMKITPDMVINDFWNYRWKMIVEMVGGGVRVVSRLGQKFWAENPKLFLPILKLIISWWIWNLNLSLEDPQTWSSFSQNQTLTNMRDTPLKHPRRILISYLRITQIIIHLIPAVSHVVVVLNFPPLCMNTYDCVWKENARDEKRERRRAQPESEQNFPFSHSARRQSFTFSASSIQFYFFEFSRQKFEAK